VALQPGDVQRIVDGHSRARAAVNAGDLLSAANVLCEEFGALLSMRQFWDNVIDVTQTQGEHAAAAVALLNEVGAFIEQEAAVFEGLGVKEAQWSQVLKDAMSGRLRSEDATALAPGQLTLELRAFERDLLVARDLICEESKIGPGKAATRWIVSETGVRVLADAAAMGANAAVIALPPLPLASIFAAVRAVRQDVPALIDILSSLRRRR
jgi:hypothetical protein